MQVYCTGRKINSSTDGSLIKSSHTATRLDFFGFYMLKARECTAFSAPSTKQEINKTRLISLLGNLERDIRNLHYNQMLTLIITKQPLKQSYCRKNSQFDKELADKAAKGDKTIFSAFMSAYWLAKHEEANSKLLSLLKLLETSGVEHMKYFSYKGEETLRDVFLTIGEVIQDTITEQATQAGCYGILMDEVTDISV